MRIVRSVRFKVFIGFVLVIVPLMGFLIYNNIYSNYVVHDQVSLNYTRLLSQYVTGVDNTLKEFNNFLFQLSYDADLNNIQVYKSDSNEYVLAKQRTATI
jgi:two-component system sensor histidine kinase YesM